MWVCTLQFMSRVIFPLAFLITVANHSYAAACFSPSYSVQEGRGKFEEVITRNLVDNEYEDLKALFQSLEGEWSGTMEVVVCEGSEDDVRREIENFSVKSVGSMKTSGRFTLDSRLHSRQKKSRHQEYIRLYLSEQLLASEANRSVSDIELVSVSSNELIYLKKRQRKSGSGAKIPLEWITTIKMADESSFTIEQLLYVHGFLRSTSTWQFEK